MNNSSEIQVTIENDKGLITNEPNTQTFDNKEEKMNETIPI